MSVRFSTRERIIGIDNIIHGPEVVFFWDNQTRTADNITGSKDNFTAVYRIKSSESDLQKDIDYRITIHDPAGNHKQYLNSTGLISKIQSSGKGFRIDTVPSEIQVVKLSTDNGGITMFDDSNKLMVGDNHTLTVEFSTDERIIGLYDNDSRRPEFEFIWDNVTRSADNITGTKDNFTAIYTIKSGD